MKDVYEKPFLNVIMFRNEDVITTSGELGDHKDDDNNELPFNPLSEV